MSSKTTPFLKRMRTNGGTLFSFNSSIEDIGLNINEKNNVVKISHFALLDIPSIENSNKIGENWFNVQAINGAWRYEGDSTSIKDGRVLVAESFQNYASNLETVLLDQSSYNPSLQDTVSERVFWKWLKETGAIRWVKDGSGNFVEDTHTDYTSVVKYVGPVSVGNVRRDTYGTYNETYIMVPTSHGQTSVYFKQITDANYDHGFVISDLTDKISGRSNWLQPHPDGLSYNAYYDFVDSSTNVGAYTMDVSSYNYSGSGWWYTTQSIEPGNVTNAYITDTSAYLSEDPSSYSTDLTYTGTNGFAFRRSNVDCMAIEFDLDALKTIYGDSGLTYNKMATTYAINNAFDFNAALIYYSVYNSTQDEVLAVNLLGVMFLDAPSGNSSNIGSGGITIPALEKIQSQATGFGSAYSLRLNIKSDNTIDDTQSVNVDYATSDVSYAEDFNDTMAELKKTIQILNQQTAVNSVIANQYNTLSTNQSNILGRIDQQEQELNDVNLAPIQLRNYNFSQDVSIIGNFDSNTIQDVSIAALTSVQSVHDASIAVNSTLINSLLGETGQIYNAKLTLTASDLADLDTSINGKQLIAAPLDGYQIAPVGPMMITFKYNGVAWTPDDTVAEDDFELYYPDTSTSLYTVAANLSTRSVANESKFFAAYTNNAEPSGGYWIRTQNTYSGAVGDIVINMNYTLVDIT